MYFIWFGTLEVELRQYQGQVRYTCERNPYFQVRVWYTCTQKFRVDLDKCQICHCHCRRCEYRTIWMLRIVDCTSVVSSEKIDAGSVYIAKNRLDSNKFLKFGHPTINQINCFLFCTPCNHNLPPDLLSTKIIGYSNKLLGFVGELQNSEQDFLEVAKHSALLINLWSEYDVTVETILSSENKCNEAVSKQIVRHTRFKASYPKP